MKEVIVALLCLLLVGCYSIEQPSTTATQTPTETAQAVEAVGPTQTPTTAPSATATIQAERIGKSSGEIGNQSSGAIQKLNKGE